jgi:hypothetical protein
VLTPVILVETIQNRADLGDIGRRCELRDTQESMLGILL